MFRSSLLALCAVSLAAPAANPPQFVKIEEKDGSLVVPVTTIVYKSVPVTVTANENGQPVTRTVNQLVPESVTTYRKLDAAAGDYFTPAGERIDPKTLADVLKKGAVVAVAADGKPLDADVVKKHKEVVAVLVLKTEAKSDPPAGKKDAAGDKPFVTDGWLKDGAVVIVRETVTQQQVTRQEVRTTPDGKKTVVNVPIQVPVSQRVTVTLDSKAIEVQSPEGKIVEAADWGKVLKEKAKVIVSPNGRPVPEEFRKANKDIVAVVLIKARK
jgi:hypothetical protein